MAATVYRLYDAAGTLLYVGSSIHPWRRIALHATKSWGPSIATITVSGFDTEDDARQAEVLAIVNEHPVHNCNHVPMTVKVAAIKAPGSVSDGRRRAQSGSREAQVMATLFRFGPLTQRGVERRINDDQAQSFVGTALARLVDKGIVTVVDRIPSTSGRWKDAAVYDLAVSDVPTAVVA